MKLPFYRLPLFIVIGIVLTLGKQIWFNWGYVSHGSSSYIAITVLYGLLFGAAFGAVLSVLQGVLEQHKVKK